MTIKEAQQMVDEWIHRYGVRYFSELTNMACLTEEVGELARVMARSYGDQSFKPGERPNLGEEMADVLWVLLCLANQTGVDHRYRGRDSGPGREGQYLRPRVRRPAPCSHHLHLSLLCQVGEPKP